MKKEQFEDIKQRLKIWREERNITQESQRICLFDNIKEELEEYEKAKDDLERVDALCDIAVLILNSYDLGVEQLRYDFFTYDIFVGDIISNINYHLPYIKDFKYAPTPQRVILSLCFYYLSMENFDSYKCMLECIKHISSREQDPIQAKEWEDLRKQGLPITEKWLKNKYQDKSTIYLPDYKNCRIIK